MDLTEFYYERGQMPDRFYNQLNKKSANENYRKILKKRSNKKGFILSVIESSLRVVINTALDEILKDFNTRSAK